MAVNGILIGLGNPIMSDDGIGIVVSREVHERLDGYDLDTSSSGGFDIVDRILGHKRAVIIDSMATGRCEPGTVVRINPDSPLETHRIKHSHGMNFLEAIETARSCGAPVPDDVVVYGIEVDDPFTVGSEISAALLAGLPEIVGEIVRDLKDAR
jgi:hydrogenase maturation protease